MLCSICFYLQATQDELLCTLSSWLFYLFIYLFLLFLFLTYAANLSFVAVSANVHACLWVHLQLQAKRTISTHSKGIYFFCFHLKLHKSFPLVCIFSTESALLLFELPMDLQLPYMGCGHPSKSLSHSLNRFYF